MADDRQNNQSQDQRDLNQTNQQKTNRQSGQQGDEFTQQKGQNVGSTGGAATGTVRSKDQAKGDQGIKEDQRQSDR